MSAPSPLLIATLMVSGALAAGPAPATTYRCDGNLVTDSPTRGTNCVAMGAHRKSASFSAEMVEATIETQPTGAGRTATSRDAASPHRRESGATPSASAKP